MIEFGPEESIRFRGVVLATQGNNLLAGPEGPPGPDEGLGSDSVEPDKHGVHFAARISIRSHCDDKAIVISMMRRTSRQAYDVSRPPDQHRVVLVGCRSEVEAMETQGPAPHRVPPCEVIHKPRRWAYSVP